MRQLKRRSLESAVQSYAALCAEAGLYKPAPPKADWQAICAKVATDCGVLTIPYKHDGQLYRTGVLYTVWAKAYDAAKRRTKAGKPLAVAAKPVVRRKRTAKPKASAGTVTLTLTAEQAALLQGLLQAAATA